MHVLANSEQRMFQKLSNHLSISAKIESQTARKHASAQIKKFATNRTSRRIINEISKGELLLHFQPKINLEKNAVALKPYCDSNKTMGKFLDPIF